MIKGVLTQPDGKAALVFLGITAGNVGRLKEGRPILIHGVEIGLQFDICIAYEETELMLQEKIKKYINKDTVIHDRRTEQQKLDDQMRHEAAIHKMGPTGDYPEGTSQAMDESDEGGLRVGVSVHPGSGNVVINFGKSVAWVGLPPGAAEEFAHSILTASKAALEIVPKS